jgi:RHS repeat-associated protein
MRLHRPRFREHPGFRISWRLTRVHLWVLLALATGFGSDAQTVEPRSSPPAPRLAPAATLGYDLIDVSFGALRAATTYTLRRATLDARGRPVETVDFPDIQSTTYADTSVEQGASYQYQYRGCNAAGCSSWSIQTPMVSIDPNDFGGSPTAPVVGQVGRIDAKLEVTPSGQAAYTVPVKVPTGILGIQPKLSLAFNSAGSQDDLAGVGFSIAGLPRITRCEATRYHDGEPGSVDFGPGDRFCLDGMPLVVRDGQVYGAAASEYRTAIETWTRIVAGPLCLDTLSAPGIGPVPAQGPCRFDATLKTGNKVIFGGLGAEHCNLAGVESPVPVLWPITRLEDLNGNVMTVIYRNGGPQNCVPDVIAYTSNVKTGDPARNEVRFLYTLRSDITIQYYGGFQKNLNLILDKIRTVVKGTQYPGGEIIATEYRFVYDLSTPGTLRRRLKYLYECDKNGNCLPYTSFSWQAKPIGNDYAHNDSQPAGSNIAGGAFPALPSTSNSTTSADSAIYSGDLNGDGRPDFFTVGAGNHECTLSALYAFERIQWLSTPASNGTPRPSGGTSPSHQSTGFPPAWRYPCSPPEITLLDLNGDGFDDILERGIDAPGYAIWYGSSQGVVNNWFYDPPPTYGTDPWTALPHAGGQGIGHGTYGATLLAGDFAGDGRKHVIVVPNKPTQPHWPGWAAHEFDPVTETFSDVFSWNDGQAGVADGALSPYGATGDFDGDGRTDFLFVRHVTVSSVRSVEWHLFLSRSDGRPSSQDGDPRLSFVLAARGVWPVPGIQTHYQATPYSLAVTDLNADGKDDVILNVQLKDCHLQIPNQFELGYTALMSTGRTLLPYIDVSLHDPNWVQAYDPETNSYVTIHWGVTATDFTCFDKLVPINLNSDNKGDLAVAYSPRPCEETYPACSCNGGACPGQYSAIRLFAAHTSPGKFYLVQYIPHSPAKPFVATDIDSNGQTDFYTSVGAGSCFASTCAGRWVETAGPDASNLAKPDLLTYIVDGYNRAHRIVYTPMANGPFYSKGTGATYPAQDFAAPIYLVSSVGHGRANTSEDFWSYYAYKNAQLDHDGLGFLAFESTTADNAAGDNRVVETSYRRDYPFAGLVQRQKVYYKSGPDTYLTDDTAFSHDWVNRPDYQDGLDIVRAVRLLQKQSNQYDCTSSTDDTTVAMCTGQIVHTTTTDYLIDSWGNTTQMKEIFSGPTLAPRKKTTVRYYESVLGWGSGYLKEEQIWEDLSPLIQPYPTQHTKFTYDTSRMNVTEQRNWVHGELWLATTLTHDLRGRVRTSTDPSGKVTQYEYDVYGYLYKTIDPLNLVRERRFDPRFAVEIRTTDPNGNTVYTDTDDFGRTTRVRGVNPSSLAVEEFQKIGLTSLGAGIVKQTYLRRSWTTLEWDWKEEFYDHFGRLHKTRQRGGPEDNLPIETERQYLSDRATLVRRSARPFKQGQTKVWTDHAYDSKHRLWMISRPYTTAPSGAASRVVYDDRYQEVRKLEYDGANTRTTIIKLDAMGNATQRVDPMGYVSQFETDILGRVTKAISPKGSATATSYDGLGRKRQVTDSNTGTTTFGYTQLKLSTEIGPTGHYIVRTADDLDRTTLKDYFDATNTLTKQVKFVYDDPLLAYSKGELSHVEVFVDNGTSSLVLESKYDLAYDRYGRLNYRRLHIDGYQATWTKKHDPQGTLFEQTYPDGAVQRTTYTSQGAIRHVRLKEAGQSTFTTFATFLAHDADGKPRMSRYLNDTYNCYLYDTNPFAGGHPQGQTHRGLLVNTSVRHSPTPPGDPNSWCEEPLQPGATEHLNRDYVWSDINNISTIHDNLTGAASQSFGYSARGELTSATGANTYGSKSYAYDSDGNVISKDGVSYVYNGFDTLQSTSDGWSYEHDGNGHMVSRINFVNQWRYTWDGDDQLLRVQDPLNNVTSFAYDFTGKRLKKVDPDGTVHYYMADSYEVVTPPSLPTRHTKYVVGPFGNIAQITKTGVTIALAPPPSWHHQVVDAFSDTSLPGSVARGAYLAAARLVDIGGIRDTYARVVLLAAVLLGFLLIKKRKTARGLKRQPKAGMAGVTALCFVATYGIGIPPVQAALGPEGGEPDAGTYYFHQDPLRTTSLVTLPGGNTVSARVEYDPFGSIVQTASSGPDTFRAKFTGQELDGGTGLYYYGARYYDSALGRFISADTQLGGDALRTLSLNRYAYAQNNPITYNDPTGHYVWFFVALYAAVIIGSIVGGLSGAPWQHAGRTSSSGFSFEGALFGAFIGAYATVASHALGIAGSAVAEGLTAAMSIGVEAPAMSTGGVVTAASLEGVLHGGVSISEAAIRGETDAGRLATYFGAGFISGFLAGGSLGKAANTIAGGGGKSIQLGAQLGSSFTGSVLKRVANSDEKLSLSLWFVTVNIDKHGKGEWGVNWVGLATTTLSLATDIETIVDKYTSAQSGLRSGAGAPPSRIKEDWEKFKKSMKKLYGIGQGAWTSYSQAMLLFNPAASAMNRAFPAAGPIGMGYAAWAVAHGGGRPCAGAKPRCPGLETYRPGVLSELSELE